MSTESPKPEEKLSTRDRLLEKRRAKRAEATPTPEASETTKPARRTTRKK